MILDRAARGMAFLLISSDLPELLGLAHRVLVLHKGRLVGGARARGRPTPQRIMDLASTGRAAA